MHHGTPTLTHLRTLPGTPGSRRWLVMHAILLIACLAAFALATAQVHAYDAGVVRESFTIPGRMPLPAQRFSPAHDPLNVVVVVAHGYSANKEMMSAFGVDLAKQGVTTYTFDLPGHGASTVPYGGGSTQPALADQLVAAMDEAVTYALAHAPAPHPKLALIGYSLGTIAVGEYALRHPDLSSLAATVLVAGILQDHPTPSNPRNLLVLSGQFDLPGINTISTDLIASGCAVPPASVSSAYQCNPSGLYGHRERIVLRGLDHISIVTATSTHSAVIGWLHDYVDPAIGRAPVNADVRLHWMLLGFLAAGLAIFPLLALGAAAAGLVPGVAASARTPEGAGSAWRDLGRLAVALALGLLVLHILLPPSFWDPSPLAFLAQQVSADVATFLLLTGAILLVGMWAAPQRRQELRAAPGRRVAAQVALAGLVAVFLYFTLGVLSGFAWEGLTLYPPRAWRAGVYVVLIWPYFFAVQTLIAGRPRWRSGGLALELATTLLLIAALIASIASNFARLSYLGILLPVFAIVLLWLAGFNAWARRALAATPVLLATLEALVLAWVLAATLPLVG